MSNLKFASSFMQPQETANSSKQPEELAKGEQQLQSKSESELKQLQSLIHTAAHEMRTPLQAATDFSKFLLKDTTVPLTAHQQDFLGSILSCLEQAQTQVENLWCLAQTDSEQFRPELKLLDLKLLVRQGLVQFTLMAQAAEVRLEAVNSEGEAYQVLGVANKLRQCLNNLLINALKFSPIGGIVRVSLKETPTEYVIMVEDNGPGISAENQPKLFQRYFQVKDRAFSHLEGYGLGLSIVKELVEQQHGRVGVESRLGEGSQFWFSLPRADVMM